MIRTPATDAYDAVVDLEDAELPRRAYALVKQTFRIEAGTCRRIAPEPLLHDFRDATLVPRFRVGTDFWPEKHATDVVVRGAAFAPGGVPTEEMTVSVACGSAEKHVRVFGSRELTYGRDGSPRFGAPTPVLEVEMSYVNAYGGIDRCAQPAAAPTPAQLLAASFDIDHPGMYPRNPFGKGYVVERGKTTVVALPNVEDPDDLLTEARIVVGDPARWYEQPLPWCFDWQHPLMFPRYVHFAGAPDAWFPGPEDERMPEVRRGYLAPGYRSRGGECTRPGFFQEGSHGLVLAGLTGTETLRVRGMHPRQPVVEARLPGKPSLVFEVDGGRVEPDVRIHTIRCEPAEERLCIVFGATVELPRVFVPGVHRRIPVAVRVDGDAPVAYPTPPTVHEKLTAAGVL
ncbi:MAG: DUF2169 domain-containing protein [Myxococcales bacterium]|nr:DUF2169 domain-containing protein [Myxococcales bacterium]